MDSELAQAGGLDGLRALLRTFYDAVYEDVMIGYLFWNVDKEQIIEREAQFVARMLGDREVQYTGRPMRPAHASHRILGGHYLRRQELLKQAMEAHHLPQGLRQRWLAHNDALRPQVTADPDSACSHERAEAFAQGHDKP